MAVIALPASPPFVRTSWVPPAQNQVNRSGWTGKRKVVRLPTSKGWRVSVSVMAISREVDAWPWKAFFAASEGEANTFLMPYCRGQYVVPGTGAAVTVEAVQPADVGVQGAGSVKVGGLNVNGGLFAGQALDVLLPSGDRQLFILTSALVGDAQGKAIATFGGGLRETPAAGAAVELRDPVCVMALVGNNTPIPSDEGVYNFAFDAEEVW